MDESIKDIAQHYDELFESGADLGDLIRVKATVKKPANTVYSTRYSKDEITMIRQAAGTKGMTAGAFIRAAALAAAAENLDIDTAGKAARLNEVVSITEKLHVAVTQLKEALPAPAGRRSRASK